LKSKTLFNVLRQLFIAEFGYHNKVIFAEAMIERILETVAAFTQPAALLQSGQLLWMAVANDGHKHAHKPMAEIPQVPVVLDLVTEEDVTALADGQDYRAVRQQRHARLLDQAFAQGGVLAQTDLAAITLISPNCVAADTATIQKAQQRILPYRGSVQDIGATLTHKVEVIRLLEAGYLEPEICRLLSLPHNLSSVENYVQTYKNITKLLERGFSPGEVSGILAVHERLVLAYVPIIHEHHPRILAHNVHVQELLSSAATDPT
jgi:hypothetical protein